MFIFSFTFPEVKTTRTIEERIQKVKDELNEFESGNNKDEEVIDILHAVETLVRKQFEYRPKHEISRFIEKVIEKNNKRGYYTKKCF